MVSGHGARVRYSPDIKVNTHFFFQVPTIEFGHGDGAPQKWAPGRRVHTVLIVSSGAVHCFVLPTKLMFQMASGKAQV